MLKHSTTCQTGKQIMAKNSNPKKRESLSLPLEWTQISRGKSKQRRKKENNNDSDSDFMSCCESCPPSEIRRNSASAHHIREQTQEINNEASHPLSTTLNGKGIFCLHSLDTDWFQGYFIPDNSNSISNLNSKRKPLALLAVNRNDVDDCLQCSDGGYREIDLTAFSSAPKKFEEESNVKEKKQTVKKRKTKKWTRVICTGGDMLCFSESTTPITTESSSGRRQDGKLRFEAEKVLTGEKVEPFMKRYFSNLLQHVVRNVDVDRVADKQNTVGAVGETICRTNVSTLELLPECAIVSRSMTISVPLKFV